MPLTVVLLALAAALSAPPLVVQSSASLRSLVPGVEKNLNVAVLAFWYPRCIDREYGGYLVDYDAEGRFKGEAAKMIRRAYRQGWALA